MATVGLENFQESSWYVQFQLSRLLFSFCHISLHVFPTTKWLVVLCTQQLLLSFPFNKWRPKQWINDAQESNIALYTHTLNWKRMTGNNRISTSFNHKCRNVNVAVAVHMLPFQLHLINWPFVWIRCCEYDKVYNNTVHRTLAVILCKCFVNKCR